MSRLRDQVEEKHISISLAHTIPNPWAMMVEGCNAMVALLTVLAAERLNYYWWYDLYLFDVAHSAVLGFHKEDDVIISI